jgi:hypothetical protein
MRIDSSMVAAVCHEKAAPGKVECDCGACWQVRQLRLAPGRATGSEVSSRASRGQSRAFTMAHVGGVL